MNQYDSMDITPERALGLAQAWLQNVKNGEVRDAGNNPSPEPDACLVIMLCKDDTSMYGTWRIASGLSIVDTLSLLEIMKFRLLMEMHSPQQSSE